MRAKVLYVVMVSNFGTVYYGGSKKAALEVFREYKAHSENEYGRAAGESVLLSANGDIQKDWVGALGYEIV